MSPKRMTRAGVMDSRRRWMLASKWVSFHAGRAVPHVIEKNDKRNRNACGRSGRYSERASNTATFDSSLASPAVSLWELPGLIKA
jgi:hypothetical protein